MDNRLAYQMQMDMSSKIRRLHRAIFISKTFKFAKGKVEFLAAKIFLNHDSKSQHIWIMQTNDDLFNTIPQQYSHNVIYSTSKPGFYISPKEASRI